MSKVGIQRKIYVTYARAAMKILGSLYRQNVRQQNRERKSWLRGSHTLTHMNGSRNFIAHASSFFIYISRAVNMNERKTYEHLTCVRLAIIYHENNIFYLANYCLVALCSYTCVDSTTEHNFVDICFCTFFAYFLMDFG